MILLDRYIARTLVTHTFIVVCVLLALFTFFGLIDELDDVGKGSYGLAQAGQFVLLSIPRLLTQLFPIAVLIGAIGGLGVLARNNELTVIRAAGVPVKRIAWAVMKVGLAMVVVVTVVGEWIVPDTEHRAQVLRTVSLSQTISFKSRNGLWARDGLSIVNIREILADGRLSEVQIYEFESSSKLRRTVYGKFALNTGGAWRLQDVTTHEISPDGTRTTQLPELEWATQLSPELLDVVVVKPDTLSTAGLSKYVGYLKDNGLDADRYEVALWSKISAPLVTALMVFLAIPFAFGPLRSVTAGQRLVVGTLVGVAFYLVSQLSTYVTLVFELNAIAGALAPTVLCAAIGTYFLRRVF